MDALVWVEIGLFGLGVLVALLGALAMIIFKQIASDIRRMADNVEKLNVNVAVVIERTDNHERRISRLEGDIS